MTRLNLIVGFALIVAIGANILALLQQSMVFFNVSLLTVIEQNLWSVVRIGSRFGDIWNARMILLIIGAGLFAGSLYWRETQPESVRAFWTANAWLFALILATFSIISHGAGSLLLPWIAIAVDWLHLIGVGFWVGGLMALVLVLRPALRPYVDEARRVALLAVLKRFSPLAFASAIVVTVSGMYSASLWINEADDLQTTFGASLLFKIALIALLLSVAAIHRITLVPERFARWHGRFQLTLPIESGIAIGVLAAAGWLTATPIPVPDFAQAEIAAPQGSISVNDYTISQTIIPGGPGVNTYDTVITRNGQPVEGLTVVLQKAQPSRDFRGEWQASENVEAGLYVGAGAEIDRPGEWWTVVNLRDQDGQVTRAAFQWTISDEAAVIQTQPPGAQQVILLLILSAVLIWIVLPTVQRILKVADLNPVSVTLAIGAITATILVLLLSTAFVQESQRQFENAQNPPPAIINPTLPDQASLTRGAALYQVHCAEWTPDQADFRALALRLTTVRDEELFRYTQVGWRSLPPCEGELDDPARWDLVNYVRTLADDQ
jgi:putative copper export protein